MDMLILCHNISQYVDVKCMLMLHVVLLGCEFYVLFVRVTAWVEQRDQLLPGLRRHA
jgi:hypothetical protein